MSGIPFHSTRMGMQFYEHTMPAVAEGLKDIAARLGVLVTEEAEHRKLATRALLATQVYDAVVAKSVSTLEFDYLGEDVAYLLGAILRGTKVEFGKNRPILGILRNAGFEEALAEVITIDGTDRLVLEGSSLKCPACGGADRLFRCEVVEAAALVEVGKDGRWSHTGGSEVDWSSQELVGAGPEWVCRCGAKFDAPEAQESR